MVVSASSILSATTRWELEDPRCSCVYHFTLSSFHCKVLSDSIIGRVKDTGRPDKHSGPPKPPIVPFSKCADSECSQNHPVQYSTVFLLLRLEESPGLFSILSFVGLVVMQNQNRETAMNARQKACDAAHILVRRTEPDVSPAPLGPFRPRRLVTSDPNHPAEYSPIATSIQSSKILARYFRSWLHSCLQTCWPYCWREVIRDMHQEGRVWWYNQ